jgi:hypothetical protein
MPDLLHELFRMQRELNEMIFAKHPPDFSRVPKSAARAPAEARGFPRGRSARPAEARAIWRAFVEGTAPPEAVRDWTLNYARALVHEAAELEDSCNWKWWSNDPPIDLQNARVEVIDLWHFLISASLVVGLSPQDVYEVYRQKWRVNRARQVRGYSRAGKTEDENRAIAPRGGKKRAARRGRR